MDYLPLLDDSKRPGAAYVVKDTISPPYITIVHLETDLQAVSNKAR